jgi:hypothetical protein
VNSNSGNLDNVFGSYFDDASNILTMFADTDSSVGVYEVEKFEVAVGEDSAVDENDITLAAFIA